MDEKLQLRAWRTIGRNPGGDNALLAPVHISIGARPRADKTAHVFPWVLTMETAAGLFGQDTIEQIGTDPVDVVLSLEIKK